MSSRKRSSNDRGLCRRRGWRRPSLSRCCWPDRQIAPRGSGSAGTSKIPRAESQMTERVTATAARALLRSRLLSPPSPAALVRLIGEVGRAGTNPYTLLAVAAERWPNRMAIVDDDGAVTYRQLQVDTEALASQLLDEGVAPGQAVGIMCRNGRGFLRAVFATALVGADIVLVNTDFQSDALAAALSGHEIEMIVADAEFAARVRAADDAAT